MGNLGFNLKRFLQNKNTVTIIGTVLIVLILYFGYNWRVKSATTLVEVPYAKVEIQPRTQITEDMIGQISVPKSMLNYNILKNLQNIVGKWSNYNSLIPKGSLFYNEAVVSAEELPDAAFVNIKSGETAFYLPVDTETTYGNSIYPGNYIDIYFKAINDSGKVMVGKLLQNVKILAVKDKNGQHVFENSSENRTPSIIIFALREEEHLLLRRATYLQNDRIISAEIIPVPTTESYSTDPGSTTITNAYLKNFINIKTAETPQDELPEILDPSEDR